MDISKLDKCFSLYIRQRDTDEYGCVKCCTCDTISHWSEMDAGHFVRRGNMSVRFDERNCHAQCKQCNQFEDGREDNHLVYIAIRYGGMVPFNMRAKSHESLKLMQYEIDEMVQEYKEKIANLP